MVLAERGLGHLGTVSQLRHPARQPTRCTGTRRDVAGNTEVQKNVSFSVGYQPTSSYQTSFTFAGTAWMDVASWSTGPWANFLIYADGVLIGTKNADDGTSTWNCPGDNVSSGARIDIVQNVGWNYGGRSTTRTRRSPTASTCPPARLGSMPPRGPASRRCVRTGATTDMTGAIRRMTTSHVALDGGTIGNIVYSGTPTP